MTKKAKSKARAVGAEQRLFRDLKALKALFKDEGVDACLRCHKELGYTKRQILFLISGWV